MKNIFTNYILVFFFLFCIGYNNFFESSLSYMANQKLMVIFAILFVAVNNSWKQFAAYFTIQNLSKKHIKTVGIFVLSAIIIQIVSIFLARYFDRPLFNQYQYAFPFWISPLLEEIFYIGIALHTLWLPFSKQTATENYKMDYTILLPVLVVFYWIILSRTNSDTKFLDESMPITLRLLDFPGATFLGFLLSSIAFSKTRSLIPPLLIHYSMNIVVWLWIKM